MISNISLNLFINEEEEQRIISQQMLSVLGYTVHTAKSGEEAIAWFQDNSAELLLLDMIMGDGMNGRETYEQVIKGFISLNSNIKRKRNRNAN